MFTFTLFPLVEIEFVNHLYDPYPILRIASAKLVLGHNITKNNLLQISMGVTSMHH